jgi:hypothetical protein
MQGVLGGFLVRADVAPGAAQGASARVAGSSWIPLKSAEPAVGGGAGADLLCD